MYFCLGCLACMTACPAGVNYAELFEHARAEAEESGVLKNPKRTFIRALTLRWLFFDFGRLQLLGSAIRLYLQLGLYALVPNTGVLKKPNRTFIRALTLRWLFFDIGRLQLLGSAIRLYQQLGLQALVRNSGVLNLFPKRMRELEAMTPTIQPKFSSELIAPIT